MSLLGPSPSTRAIESTGRAFSEAMKAVSVGYYPPTPPLRKRPRFGWRRKERWERERLARIEAQYEREMEDVDVLDEFNPTPEEAEWWLRTHPEI